MAAVNPPLGLQASGQKHPAKLFRRALAGIVTEGIDVFNGANDLKVQAAGSPNMSVDVLMGGCYVTGDDTAAQGVYFCFNDATLNLAVTAAHATLARKDIVVARVKDNSEGVAGDLWELAVIAGTPATAGSEVEPALPATALKLATIAVPAADTAIDNSQITDRRVKAAEVPERFVGMTGFTAGHSNLTDDTASGTSFEVWDVAKVVFATNPGRAIHVIAWFQGYASNTSSTNLIVESRVDISFDNGGSWDAGQSQQANVDSDTHRRVPVAPHHYRTGTPTGAVQARAMLRQNAGGAGGDVTFANGNLLWIAFPA